jgi:thymidylate kinase
VRALGRGPATSRGITVALVGLDGAGKTTVAGRLAAVLDRPTAYVYMGINAGSSNRMLPTTRFIEAIKRRRDSRRHSGSGNAMTREPRPAMAPGGTRPVSSPRARPDPLRFVLGLVRIANRIAEEIYRQRIASGYRGKGRVVILDRDFLFDFYAADVDNRADRSFANRMHGVFLRRFYPRPDLLLFLDAPAEVVFARKGEGSLESLTRRREGYHAALSLVPRKVILDATRSLDEVTRDAAAIINRVLVGEDPELTPDTLTEDGR